MAGDQSVLSVSLHFTGPRTVPTKVSKLTEDSADDQIEECNITLYTKVSLTASEILMTECFGSAVIDTECTRTVWGQQCLDSYITELNERE